MLKVLWTTEFWFAVVCIRYCPSSLSVVPWSGLPRRACPLSDRVGAPTATGGRRSTARRGLALWARYGRFARGRLSVFGRDRCARAPGGAEPPPCRVAERVEDLVGRHLVKHVLKYTLPTSNCQVNT